MIKLTLNPFRVMGESFANRTELYLETLKILKVWERLIRRERGWYNYTLVCEATIDQVIRTFNPEKGQLEPFVKATAKTVPIHGNNLSIDILANDEEDGATVKDLLSEENGIDWYGTAKEKERVKQEPFLWSNWVSECRERDLSELVVDNSMLVKLITSTPILDRVVTYEQEDLILTEQGQMHRSKYRSYYTSLVTDLMNNLKLPRKEIQKNLEDWVSLYLQNLKLFRTQYILLHGSDIVPFTDRKSHGKSPKADILFGMEKDIIQLKNKRSRLFRLDLNFVADYIFDNYYNENGSNLAFEINGSEFYNVLGGVFLDGGDLSKAIKENLCELVLQRTTARFIALTDKYLYVEYQKTEAEIIMYANYFGLTLPIHLENKGYETVLEGDLEYDYTQHC